MAPNQRLPPGLNDFPRCQFRTSLAVRAVKLQCNNCGCSDGEGAESALLRSERQRWCKQSKDLKDTRGDFQW
ncbi:hypothetical protein TcWFU_006973 [Taenia crassiceps]|uniref:Uncharacterized protein n=1 Tax=Taenia crassiceps TaxID=6207 RepID=A0ABR4Q4Z9_9CEST